jgi:hypothetical protein
MRLNGVEGQRHPGACHCRPRRPREKRQSPPRPPLSWNRCLSWRRQSHSSSCEQERPQTLSLDRRDRLRDPRRSADDRYGQAQAEGLNLLSAAHKKGLPVQLAGNAVESRTVILKRIVPKRGPVDQLRRPDLRPKFRDGSPMRGFDLHKTGLAGVGGGDSETGAVSHRSPEPAIPRFESLVRVLGCPVRRPQIDLNSRLSS